MTSIVRRHRPWVPAAPSWRALLTLILVVSACAYVIPVERSMGRLTATKSNVSVLSSGTLLAPAAVVPVATGANSIRVAWTQSASPFATGYAIYRISGVEPDFSLVGLAWGAATTTYDDLGLQGATGYTYYVVTLCQNWESPPSPIGSAFTN